MKFFALAFLLLFSTNSFAVKYVKGEGRFYSKDDDSLGMVNDQLITSAFHDVIGKELESMGLDSELFWQQFDLKFEEYFNPIELSVKRKYGLVDEQGNPREDLDASTRKNKEDEAQKVLRLKRLNARSKFGKLRNAIISYSIKKRSRSPQYPNSRYISLSAKVNRRILSGIYLKLTSEGTERSFKKVFLTSKFILENCTWDELGVIGETDFTDVVKDHWKKWFQQNIKKTIEEVVVTTPEMEEKLNARSRVATMNQGSSTVESSTSSIATNSDTDGLWVKIETRISKTFDNVLLKKRTFKIEGEYIVKDLLRGEIFFHYDFAPETHSYVIEDKQKFSSAIASHVYSIPLSSFRQIESNLPNYSGQLMIELNNIETIQDALEFNELLRQKAVTLQAQTELKQYTKENARVLVSFRGPQAKLYSILRDLENKELNTNKIVTFSSRDRPYIIVLKQGEKTKLTKDEDGKKKI